MIKVIGNKTTLSGSPVEIAAEVCCAAMGFQRCLKNREKETGLMLGKFVWDSFIATINEIKYEGDDEDGDDDEAEEPGRVVETPAGLYRWLRSQRGGRDESIHNKSGSLGD